MSHDPVDDAPPAVEFSHVSLAFDEHVVFSDLSLSIPKGAMRILIGVSGSGKSVILKLVLGLIRPDAGEIRLNGAAAVGAQLEAARLEDGHRRRGVEPRPVGGPARAGDGAATALD